MALHSEECIKLNFKKLPVIKETFNEYNDFLKLIYHYLNNLNFFDIKVVKNDIYNIYKENNFKFEYNIKKINKILNNFKKNSIKFSKDYIFKSNMDLNNKYFLRDYSYFLVDSEHKKNRIPSKYGIWGTDYMIAHMRESLCIFIDGTWYRPKGMCQILIFMFKDSLTKEKIPGLFVVTNNKTEELYASLLHKIKLILTQNNIYKLGFQYIISDNEIALINSINSVFPEIRRISCFFHYAQNIRKNLSKYGFLKKDYLEESNLVISKLCCLPFLYKGSMDKFNNLILNIKEQHPIYNQYIEEYFIPNKIEYFKNESYNYCLLPKDCRSNSSIERYIILNGYLVHHS